MAAHHNTYSSIVPSQMTAKERAHMRIELTSAKNWGLDHVIVNIPSGQYKNPVSRLKDYESINS